MGRFFLLLVICALGAGALYVWQRRRADQENVPVATVAASRPVVTNSGCTAQQSVFFDLHSAEVGSPITGKIGRHRACEGSDIDHMSGEVDWGDGTSSTLNAALAGPNDRDVTIAGQHVYTQRGRFAVFARVRAECLERGQWTRVISCGRGVIDVQ